METTKTCTATTGSSNVVSTVEVDGFCGVMCDATSTYVIRLKNLVNLLYVKAYSGTMTIETRVDATSLVSTGTYSLSAVPTILPGILTPATVTRSATP